MEVYTGMIDISRSNIPDQVRQDRSFMSWLGAGFTLTLHGGILWLSLPLHHLTDSRLWFRPFFWSRKPELCLETLAWESLSLPTSRLDLEHYTIDWLSSFMFPSFAILEVPAAIHRNGSKNGSRRIRFWR